MKKQLLDFRCPSEIVDCLDALAAKQNMSRTDIMQEAIDMMMKVVRKRRGVLIPPLSKNVKLNIPNARKSASRKRDKH